MTRLFLLNALLVAQPAREPLVEVTAFVTDAVIDLRYATPLNFVHKQMYPTGARCLVLEHAAEQLVVAAQVLRGLGFRLKLYDCYRPHSVQYELWKVMPKPGYVADPKTGSNHNRGAAIDLTLVTLEGDEVVMPSAYDAFGPASHHSYTKGDPAALRNRATLRSAMEHAGFVKNAMEWWHYEVPNPLTYPLRDEAIGPLSDP